MDLHSPWSSKFLLRRFHSQSSVGNFLWSSGSGRFRTAGAGGILERVVLTRRCRVWIGRTIGSALLQDVAMGVKPRQGKERPKK
jgi:hypothetical protein